MTDTKIQITRKVLGTIVALKVSRQLASMAQERLQLAEPLHFRDSEPGSLWLGPDHWWLLSEVYTPADIAERCSSELDDILHSALDYSSALVAYRVEGCGAREVLAMGSSLDLRSSSFPAGRCARTRFAQTATVIVAAEAGVYELYVGRSVSNYIFDWLQDSAAIANLAAGSESLLPTPPT